VGRAAREGKAQSPWHPSPCCRRLRASGYRLGRDDRLRARRCTPRRPGTHQSRRRRATVRLTTYGEQPPTPDLREVADQLARRPDAARERPRPLRVGNTTRSRDVPQDRVHECFPLVSCAHRDHIRLSSLPESVPGCQECLASGDPWLHLRICLECGHVGCCDESPNRHTPRTRTRHDTH